MKTPPSLIFAKNAISPTQFVDAARAFTGLRYATTGTYSVPPLGKDGGDVSGRTDCAGVLLLAVRRLGLWPSDFPVDLAWPIFKRERPSLLVEILTRNFYQVKLEELQVGDVMFLRYGQAAGNDPGGRHLAILTATTPPPRGSMIHCWCDGSGHGRVFEQRIDATTWKCVRRVWRMKNFDL